MKQLISARDLALWELGRGQKPENKKQDIHLEKGSSQLKAG